VLAVVGEALVLDLENRVTLGSTPNASLWQYGIKKFSEGYDDMVSLTASPPVPAKVPRIAVYLSQEVKEKLDRLADQEKRSLSQMAAILLEESLLKAEQEGRLKPLDS
jgi:hypothetical protein